MSDSRGLSKQETQKAVEQLQKLFDRMTEQLVILVSEMQVVQHRLDGFTVRQQAEQKNASSQNIFSRKLPLSYAAEEGIPVNEQHADEGVVANKQKPDRNEQGILSGWYHSPFRQSLYSSTNKQQQHDQQHVLRRK